MKTYGEAIAICEKYGIAMPQPKNLSLFTFAEALLSAYKDGAKEPTNAADTKQSCDHNWIELHGHPAAFECSKCKALCR